MAKMGISTLQSYKAAQIFEAVGLSQDVVDMCFTNTASRIAGSGFDILASEMCSRHSKAFGLVHTADGTTVDPQQECTYRVNGGEKTAPDVGLYSRNPGFYYWRQGGERHMNDPLTIAKLQVS